MDDAINATVATCRTCNGWTLLIANCADDTADDRRDNAKSVAAAIKNGRDIHTMTMDAARALGVCKCPRPEKRGRK